MSTTLSLLRHGRATGQAPDAELTPEGEAHLRLLGARLAAQGWLPDRVYCSPYRRARQTAALLLATVGSTAPISLVSELIPETRPEDALAALRLEGIASGRSLVVAHLPLLGLLCGHLTADDPGFHPGTLVEIELDEETLERGNILWHLGPDELR